VQRQKSTKTKTTTGRSRKPLGARYAEVLKLRLAVEQAQQHIKSLQAGRQLSAKATSATQ
jgi:hypothetical protein